MWFRMLWRVSDCLRRGVSRLPYGLRYGVSQLLALIVYWPLARSAHVMEVLGFLPSNWPLAYYRDKKFYVMRTDALDRFGTQLETRFTREQIRHMMELAGFEHVQFSDCPPFWVAVSRRAGAVS
jgi:hypothetical protein